ncbi:LacI family DNA-binding transcriptional regulator [Nakamurella endophytica]|uniref:LacI family transcriptional regulator n=1 Tax=Nakamurella endophytica TaxID=1748367 RepID=A0A917WLL6_9ACTN|nr:LacI family DNA-binding transcriptional regulator [Nakamurella endophytica]GGM13997.1 LacI family transcriptional regulator [Nakamurella endophytica]
MEVDLRRVAAASGVSVSTASRALAGSSRVSSGTAERVRAAADALGYRPNATARALRTARTDLVGLVVTNLVNASFRVIAEVVQQALAEHGFQMVLAVTGGDAAQERAALHTLIDHNATGVIVVGLDSAATRDLDRSGLPVVHLARRPDAPAGDCVLGDDLAGARSATRHLLELGHRRIGVIAGPGDVTSGRERLLGHRVELERAGIRYRDELVHVGPFAPDTGTDGVAALLSLPPGRRPTALLVANHEASFGALPELRRRGVDVPGALSLLCFEDAELTRWWHPSVTVVDNNAAEMGALAAWLLLDRIRGDRAAGREFVEFRVGTALRVRESCRPPAG